MAESLFRSNRNNWIINGQNIDHPEWSTLIANQYLNTTVDNSVLKSWRFSEPPVQGEELKNGFSFYPKICIGSLRQPSSVKNLQDDNDFYTITIKPEKKTAVLEVLIPRAICMDDDNAIQLGTVNHAIRIHCNLSAGSPAGKPEVTKVEIKQDIKSKLLQPNNL